MSEKKKLNYLALVKGIFFSIVLTLVLIVIITGICYFGNISEKLLGLMLFLSSAISVFLSSIFMTRSVKHSGLIYGALNGLGYFLIILAASICFAGRFSPSTQCITMFIGSVLAGALGGIMGVNR